MKTSSSELLNPHPWFAGSRKPSVTWRRRRVSPSSLSSSVCVFSKGKKPLCLINDSADAEWSPPTTPPPQPQKETPSFFFYVSWRGLITMFCRAAIDVLFNLKAAQRHGDGRGGGRRRRRKWIPFLWASDTRDVWSDLGSHRTLL